MEPQQPLVCPSHTTQYFVAVIVGIIVGAGASFVYFKQAPQVTTSGENTYQDGYDAAKKRVLESALGGMFRTPDDIRTLSGTVTSVSGNRVTIHTTSTNPFEDPALDDRIIVVTADTKIFKPSAKDPKVYQAEMEAFIKKMQSCKTAILPVAPPSPSTKTIVDIASITVGVKLNVNAEENIKTIKEFSASEIQIQ